MADWPPLKNSAFTVTFPIYDADGDLVSGATGLDSEVSKDGGTFTDVSPGEATEIATSSGVYALALSATEMNADIVCTITKSNGKTAVNVMYTVSRQLKDLAFPATSGRSIQVETDGMVHGDLKEWLGSAPNALVSSRVDASVGAMASGVLTATAIAADAITAAKVAADVGAEIADAVWDEQRSGHTAGGSFGEGVNVAAMVNGAITANALAADTITAAKVAADVGAEIADAVWDEAASGHVTAGSFGQRLQPIRTGTAQGGDATKITLDAGASGTTNFYDGYIVMITGGSGVGQARIGRNYNGSTKDLSVTPNWSTSPSTDSVFVIFPLGMADVETWRTSPPLALSSQRVQAHVGGFDTGAIVAAAFAAGAINAAAIATDAIDADTLAADVALEIADAILKRDVDNVESSAAVHSLTTAILKAVSRVRDNAGTLEIYRTNGSTIHASQTVTSDAGLNPVKELTAGS
jgi:hypothetical protein